MAYIGNRPEQGNFRKCDAITTSATATYNLLVGGVAVNPNQNQCIVSLNGVIQSSGNSYTIASSQITFASALTSSDVIDFILILGDTLDVGVPSDDTISTAKIQTNAVTNAKMADDAIGVAELSATGTPSSSNFLRGDNAWAIPSGGKIGQVVSTTKTDTFTVNSRSYSAITGLSVSITPSATSSKILVIVSLQGVSSNNGDAVILRDSTQIAVGDTAGSRTSSSFGEFYNGAGSVFRSNSASILDSPSSTSAITYSVSCLTYTSSVFYVNRSATDTDSSPYSRSASTITVMEVLA